MRAVLAVLTLAACTRAPAASADFFGPTIEPPRGLAKIRPGMSVAQAKQLVPGLREDHRGVRDHLELDSGTRDVSLQVRIEAGTVQSIVAIVQGDSTRSLLTKGWGEPEIAKDALGQPEITWASERTGWKVKLDCLERNCVVEYIPYHVLTKDYFGAHVVPPGRLANLKVGMKLPEARVAAPGLIDVRAGLVTGVDGVREYVAVDDKLGVLRALYLNLPAHAEALITEAWGDGLVATEPVGKKVLVWPDPTTGWRATLRPALGSSQDLAFDTYLPAAELLGEQPDVIDAVPVLDHTVDQVKKQFPGTTVAPDRDLFVTLPPTEWERTATRVRLDIAGNRVRAISFAIPFKAHPEAKDSLYELFLHKWGEPLPPESEGKHPLVFRDADPRVEAWEDTEHDAWQLEIHR
jgi:hypothetical protein